MALAVSTGVGPICARRLCWRWGPSGELPCDSHPPRPPCPCPVFPLPPLRCCSSFPASSASGTHYCPAFASDPSLSHCSPPSSPSPRYHHAPPSPLFLLTLLTLLRSYVPSLFLPRVLEESAISIAKLLARLSGITDLSSTPCYPFVILCYPLLSWDRGANRITKDNEG